MTEFILGLRITENSGSEEHLYKLGFNGAELKSGEIERYISHITNNFSGFWTISHPLMDGVNVKKHYRIKIFHPQTIKCNIEPSYDWEEIYNIDQLYDAIYKFYEQYY